MVSTYPHCGIIALIRIIHRLESDSDVYDTYDVNVKTVLYFSMTLHPPSFICMQHRHCQLTTDWRMCMAHFKLLSTCEGAFVFRSHRTIRTVTCQ